MSESAIYFVVAFTALLLIAGVGYTFYEFRRVEAKGARASAVETREQTG